MTAKKQPDKCIMCKREATETATFYEFTNKNRNKKIQLKVCQMHHLLCDHGLTPYVCHKCKVVFMVSLETVYDDDFKLYCPICKDEAVESWHLNKK